MVFEHEFYVMFILMVYIYLYINEALFIKTK